ncbi:MAG: hypothetical protein L0Y70_04855 [Gemmataceae bacterium]|nr:hypothetical protein [Gemmataceae bacterium]
MSWISHLWRQFLQAAQCKRLRARTFLSVERLEDRTVPSQFEVWTVDQSNNRDNNGDGTLDSGGKVYIYDGEDLSGQDAATAVPEVIDLGGNAVHNFMFTPTGEAPVRPHMLMFNSNGSHAILSFVASGHVLFIDAATRQPVGVIDVDPQAHAAFPAPDDSYIIVANQNGRLLQRIFTDYSTNTFTLDPVALNLAPLQTPDRPDNRPICPIVTSDSRFTFVTVAGGGMFVVHTAAASPMTIVADYTRDMVHQEGCGGIELDGKMYINAGGAGHSDLYVFNLRDFDTTPNPPNSPAPTVVFSQDGDPNTPAGRVDSHGVSLTKHGRYLWLADRWANKIVVVDTRHDVVVNEIPLAGSLSADPAPDLMDVSPSGNRMYMALRGPIPLTANNPAFNNAVGATPGVGVMHITAGGRNGKFMAIAPISHVVAGVERADPHGLRVRVINPKRHEHMDKNDGHEKLGHLMESLRPFLDESAIAAVFRQWAEQWHVWAHMISSETTHARDVTAFELTPRDSTGAMVESAVDALPFETNNSDNAFDLEDLYAWSSLGAAIGEETK